MLNIQIGLVKVPVMALNFVNNRYSTTGLHLFSECCNAPVGNKRYCRGCNKELLATEINKGLNKDTILTLEQIETLKEFSENGIIEVLAVKEKVNLTNLIPFIQKTQLLLPSLSKGYRKTDIKTFFSFKKALNKQFCIVKLIQRGLEHLGILFIQKGDLVFTELTFQNYNNLEEINRLKEQVNIVIETEKISNPYEFEEQAKEFIGNFKPRVKEIEEVREEKVKLLNEFVNEIKKGVVTKTKIKIKEVNPFVK